MAATQSNALNISSAGIVTFDGTATFSADTVTQYDVLVGGASNAITSITNGSSGQIFIAQGASTNPTWTTSTYPTTNAVNTLLYASAANTMGALATADSGVLVTNGSGVPSWLTTPGSYSPTVVGSTTAGTQSYTTQQGRYCQIGPIMIVQFVSVGAFGNTAAGSLRVSLPNTVATVSNMNCYGCGFCQVNGTGEVGSWQAESNTNYCTLLITSTGSAASVSASNDFNCQGTIIYFVA